MKYFLRILKIIVVIIIIFIACIVTYVLTNYEKTFDAPYPDITASQDSAVIARGKYLALGPAHCAHCHAPISDILKVDAGEEVDLSGGLDFYLPLGMLYSTNITSDKETGIGKLTDGEIARVMRYGIRHDGQAILDMMPFYDLSKEDLLAIISWLRVQKPIYNKRQQNEYNFMGKVAKTFIIKPSGDGIVPPTPPVDSTAAYGKYLVNSIANCRGCHTKRNLMTGAYIGPEFAGGFEFELVNEKGKVIKGKHIVSPNLTPNQKTGIIAKWSQDVFIKRFRIGRIINGSPMPWGPFSRMSDIELKAVYKYLNTLDPVDMEIPYGIQDRDPKF